MKILFDFIPIIIFFGSFKWAEANALLAQSLVGQYLGGFMAGGGTSAAQAPILLATAIAIVATVTQIGWLLARRKKVDGMLWVSFAIIVLFGGATIYFNSEVFIKWKPTVIYWFFASVLLGARLLFKRNLIRSTMEEQVSLPDPVWQTLNLSWVGFFLIMGCLNLYVAFYFPTPTWVNFKLFGGMGFMFAFVVAQSFYLARHVKEPE